MKAPPVLLLTATLLLAGCGGANESLLNPARLDPGYYAGTASVIPRGTMTAQTFETRTFVTDTGGVRVFAIGPTTGPPIGPNARRKRRATLISTATGTPQPEGLTVAATLDGVASTGEFTGRTEPPIALDFAGSAFSLTTTATGTALPALGTGTDLATGTLTGEVVSLDARGDVDDWGDASGTLTLAPDGSALFTGTVLPTTGTGGPISADFSADGTARVDGFTTARWSSDGTRLVLRLDRPGDTAFLVLSRN